MSTAPIRLVLSDVDGTLVTSEKQLTRETISAVKQLRDNNVLFTVSSSRPPRGFSMLIEPLDLTLPLGAFNGGLMVDDKFAPLQELAIDSEIVGDIIAALSASDLSVWVYQNNDWFVLDLNGPHVQHEVGVVGFQPTKLDSFDNVRRDVAKIVGVSDDPDTIAQGKKSLKSFQVSASTSQTYYLDVTDPRANKGSVVEFLAARYSIETSSIATIGDMTNDLAMFERSGLSVAMGNASDEIRAKASRTTKSNDENGFAYAIEHLILPEV